VKLRDDKEVKLDTMLQECNQLVENLRVKLKSQIDKVLKLRKDLDLEKEEHQLTQLKYNKLKDVITLEIDDKLNKARAAVEIAADEPVYKKDIK
jgi:hypothetical protein